MLGARTAARASMKASEVQGDLALLRANGQALSSTTPSMSSRVSTRNHPKFRNISTGTSRRTSRKSPEQKARSPIRKREAKRNATRSDGWSVEQVGLSLKAADLSLR